MKTNRITVIVDFVESTFLMSALFMWLMPYGTFDPAKLGFYMSIGLALLLQFVTRFLINKYQDRRQTAMEDKLLMRVTRTIQSILLMSVLFMWLMPWGNFNFDAIGFYMCIVLAICLEFSTKYFIRRLQTRKPDFHGK